MRKLRARLMVTGAEGKTRLTKLMVADAARGYDAEEVLFEIQDYIPEDQHEDAVTFSQCLLRATAPFFRTKTRGATNLKYLFAPRGMVGWFVLQPGELEGVLSTEETRHMQLVRFTFNLENGKRETYELMEQELYCMNREELLERMRGFVASVLT